MTKKEASKFWIWLERIRDYFMNKNKWREIDEENWKKLSIHLLNIANNQKEDIK